MLGTVSRPNSDARDWLILTVRTNEQRTSLFMLCFQSKQGTKPKGLMHNVLERAEETLRKALPGQSVL